MKFPEEDHYRYHLQLDQDGVFDLHWDVDYSTTSVEFLLRVKPKVTDVWFGFGFSDYGEINDADMTVFWTDSDGWHHFQVI